MRDFHPKRVEDYTNPFLVMAFVCLFTALILVWGFYGYGKALMVALIVHLLIRRWR